MGKAITTLAISLLLLATSVAHADSYCVVQCEPASPDRAYVPFRCDAGIFGGEGGKVVCGVMHPSCSIAFFDNNVCGTGSFRKNLTELFNHTVWVIYHEGCGAWTGDAPVSLVAFRDCYDKRTPGDQQQLAKLQMKAASDPELRAAIDAAVQHIPGAFNLAGSFDWVCRHEKLGYQMHDYAAGRNIDAIRRLYHDKQKHNPNARDLLNAVKDSDVVNIYVGRHCPNVGRPPPSNPNRDPGDRPGKAGAF